MDTKEYFHLCRPSGHPDHVLCVRVGNALARAGILTMAQLCATSEEKLRLVHNLGGKGLVIVLQEKRKYMDVQPGVGGRP